MTKEDTLATAITFASGEVDINHFDVTQATVRYLAPQPDISPDRADPIWAVVIPVRKREGARSRASSLVVHVDTVTRRACFLLPP
jgi:hypothetical protein